MKRNWKLRTYRPQDCSEMAQLFYDTVHSVTGGEYTKEQQDAWASGTVDLEAWNASFLEHHTVTAEDADGRIVGFGDMAADGYLDRLYVHKDCQRQGIATAICDCLEAGCGEGREFTVHASITARPFFEKRGYEMIRRQEVERRGKKLVNYAMRKKRNGGGGTYESSSL